jgi:lipopolysaccharide export system permease protein
MKSTLYRYLLKELLPSFALGIIGFTFVLLMGRILQLTELFVNKGIALLDILRFLYYLLPSFLVLTIPMATLLSVLLTFNRLSGDNEITALKASGVSLYQMTPPVLIFAFLAYAASTALSLYALPKANYASRSLLYHIASSKAHVGVRDRVFNDDFEGLVLYIERVIPKTFQWENVFIADSRNPSEVNTIIARQGEIRTDPQRLTVTLHLENGAIHKLGRQPEVYQKIDFNAYDLRLSLKTGLKDKQNGEKHPADMSLKELIDTIQALRSKKADSNFQWIKIHEKFSIPFACLVFSILGIPLGLQSQTARAGKSIGFAWSIGVLLVYYLLTSAGTSLAERGTVPIGLGMWLPNALFLALGIYLLLKAANESPVFLMVWLNKGIDKLRQKWSDTPEPRGRSSSE